MIKIRYVEFDYYGVNVVRFYIGKDIEIDGKKTYIPCRYGMGEGVKNLVSLESKSF